jgi:hypothetical protein
MEERVKIYDILIHLFVVHEDIVNRHCNVQNHLFV